MKNNARVLAFALSMSASAFAAPFVAVGDNAELFLTANAGIKVDDNIYLLSRNEVDDMIFSFAPGVDFVFGKNSATSGNVFYRHEFLRYSDVSQQDTDLANVGFNSLYNNGKSKFDLGAAYAETAQNEVSAPGAIVPMNMTTMRALGEFGATEKTSIGTGIRFEKKDFNGPANYRDSDVWTVPVDVYFEYSPKLQASLGYRYRSTDIAGAAIDSKDHFFSVGGRGEFTPKLSGQVRLGVVQRKFANNRDDSDFGAEVDLKYAATGKSTISIGASSDYGSSATGDSTQTVSFNLGAETKIDEQWSWNISATMRAIDYPTRSDDFLQGDVGFAYAYNVNLRITGSYSVKKQSSGLASAEFNNSIISLAANLRY